MNTRPVFATVRGPVAHHVEFNDSRKYFAVAHDHGFNIYISESCELFIEQDTKKSIGVASMLGETQIIALLGGGVNPAYRPNQAVLYDTTKSTEVAAIATSKSIIKACISDRFILVVCERNANLYKHGEKIEKIASFETAANPLGLGCLGERVLVLPGRSSGQLQLVELKTLHIDIVPSHTSPLRALCLSPDDAIVASASQTGTLIRIHSTTSNARIAELRRGITPATVYSLDISPSGRYLAVTSDTSTLHIFELPYTFKTATDDRLSPTTHTTSSITSQNTDASRRSISPIGGSTMSPAQQNHGGSAQKWGSLAKLPFAPRVFTDVYSLASVTFDAGQEDESSQQRGGGSKGSERAQNETTEISSCRAQKGVVGWLDNDTLVVVSAGREARYERFAFTSDQAGRPSLVRLGWSRYMQPV